MPSRRDRPGSGRSGRRRYHLHPAGLFYIGVAVVIGVGAINSQNNLLFIVFGIALSALVFSGLMSGAMLMGTRARRRAPEVMSVDRTDRITYTVSNSARLVPAFALTITERIDRKGVAAMGVAPVGFVAQVGPGETGRVRVEVVPRRRGRLELQGVTISSAFPFGIFKKSIRFAQPETIVVLPRVRRLSPGLFRMLYSEARLGEQASATQGIGEEYYALREYARGDSPRMIAWKSSARAGELIVRQTASPASSELRILLVLDPGKEGRGGVDPESDANELVISLAASLIVEGGRRGLGVGLAIPQAGFEERSACTARHREALLRALAMIEVGGLGRMPEAPGAFGRLGPNLVMLADPASGVGLPVGVRVLGPEAIARWSLDESAPRDSVADGPERRGVA